MANTDTIHSVALVYAQRTGKEPQITNDLIRSMQNDLAQLATEYAVNNTDNFFKKEIV
jgi:hypothetical protein